MVNKQKIISLSIQASKLKNDFVDSFVIWKNHDEFIWKSELQPTPLSIKYQIKLVYKQGQHPDVFVVTPKPLPKAQNCTKLEHVYDTEKQHICLYYRKAKEWDASMLISKTIVPWISEWLFHYEIWAYTGKWNGGGIHFISGKNIKS